MARTIFTFPLLSSIFERFIFNVVYRIMATVEGNPIHEKYSSRIRKYIPFLALILAAKKREGVEVYLPSQNASTQ